MPFASRVSPETAWSCAKFWKRRTAISVVTTPASAIPARNTSGSRTRSEASTGKGLRLRRFLARVLRGRDLVAHTPHGDDRGRLAELPAQLAHVDVDSARVSGERVAPHALEQLIAREHESAVVEQLPEEVE